MLRAAATEGTATLTVTDDGVDERSEALVLLVTAAGGDDIGSLAFTLSNAPVPTLSLVSQLLLAVFLAVRGYRRHLRRWRSPEGPSTIAASNDLVIRA